MSDESQQERQEQEKAERTTAEGTSGSVGVDPAQEAEREAEGPPGGAESQTAQSRDEGS